MHIYHDYIMGIICIMNDYGIMNKNETSGGI